MAECITCGKTFPETEPFTTLTGCDGDEYGVCDQCRADMELGRLVRRMKPGDALYRDKRGWTVDPEGSELLHGDTPEAVLRAAKGEPK